MSRKTYYGWFKIHAVLGCIVCTRNPQIWHQSLADLLAMKVCKQILSKFWVTFFLRDLGRQVHKRGSLFTFTFKSFWGGSTVHLRHHTVFFFKFVKCFLVYVIFLMRVYKQQTLKRKITARILKPDVIILMTPPFCSRLVTIIMKS